MTKDQKDVKKIIALSCKKVKYLVTDNFGFRDRGEIVDAYLLFEGDDADLLYHPPSQTRRESGTLEFCGKTKENVYESCKMSFTNSPKMAVFFKKLSNALKAISSFDTLSERVKAIAWLEKQSDEVKRHIRFLQE